MGWDGYLFPRILSIHVSSRLTGALHQPPAAGHQTFQAPNFVVCSFVAAQEFPTPPLGIPAPYNHSNIYSEKVLFPTSPANYNEPPRGGHLVVSKFHPPAIAGGIDFGTVKRFAASFTEEARGDGPTPSGHCD